MPKHKSAMKQLRQSKERRLQNRARKSHMKAAVKNLKTAIDDKQGPDKEKVTSLYKTAVSTVAKTSSLGTIHKNTAARKISRLTKAANKVMEPGWLAGQHPKPRRAPVAERGVVAEAVEEIAQVTAPEAAERPAALKPTREAEEAAPELKAGAVGEGSDRMAKSPEEAAEELVADDGEGTSQAEPKPAPARKRRKKTT